MPDKAPPENDYGLGPLLRNQREQEGLSLDDATKSTKISLPILRAIENDDFERMPAEAFCRGFYTIYAKYLNLDPEEILTQYRQAKKIAVVPEKKQARPPVNNSREFSNLSEAPSMPLAANMTTVGIGIFLILCGIGWYLSWNPISYFKSLLFQQPPPVTSTATNYNSDDIITDPGATEILTDVMNTTDTSENAQKPIQEQPTAEAATTTGSPYDLTVTFTSSGMLKVTLDDGLVLDKQFTAGETLHWKAEEKISLDMPKSIQGTINLNGVQIALPPIKNGRRKLSLPEGILD